MSRPISTAYPVKKGRRSSSSRRPAYSPESGWIMPDSSGKNRLMSGRAMSSVTRPPPSAWSVSPWLIGRW